MPRRRVLADLTPLRESRDYRLLFSGQVASYIGRQFTVVAIPIQVFKITHSSLDVGLVGLASLGPLIVFSLAGGAMSDAFDRRKLLLINQVLLAATSVVLALNASLKHPALWPLFVFGSLSAGFAGADMQTRNAITPRLVSRQAFPAAAALGQLVWQVGMIVGPVLAGLVIAQVSLATAYWIDVSTFVVAFAAAIPMHALPPEGGGTRAGLQSVLEGLRFLKGKQVLVSTFTIDINAMVFGMPSALFPQLGTQVFGGGAQTVGLLYAAPGAGALIGALFSGWVPRVRRQGRAVIIAVMLWGAAIAAFGVVTWLPAALVFLAAAGAADVVSAVFRNTILQLSLPDAFRGRLSGVHIAVVAGGPRLGDAEAGAIAALATPQISVVSGGLACIAGALVIARLVPAFTRYDSRDALVYSADGPIPAAKGEVHG
ncbi:MAG: MFS transporter [Acidimicrobiia bacterium]|nr:MFS transporter [Acidimicrobiia bacterium]